MSLYILVKSRCLIQQFCSHAQVVTASNKILPQIKGSFLFPLKFPFSIPEILDSTKNAAAPFSKALHTSVCILELH